MCTNVRLTWRCRYCQIYFVAMPEFRPCRRARETGRPCRGRTPNADFFERYSCQSCRDRRAARGMYTPDDRPLV